MRKVPFKTVEMLTSGNRKYRPEIFLKAIDALEISTELAKKQNKALGFRRDYYHNACCTILDELKARDHEKDLFAYLFKPDHLSTGAVWFGATIGRENFQKRVRALRATANYTRRLNKYLAKRKSEK